MKITVHGKKRIVDCFVLEMQNICRNEHSLIDVVFSEQYRSIQRGFGSENTDVTIIIQTPLRYLDKEIVEKREYRGLEICIDFGTSCLEKHKGCCRCSWVMHTFFEYVKESENEVSEDDGLGEYEDLEMYEERLSRR